MSQNKLVLLLSQCNAETDKIIGKLRMLCNMYVIDENKEKKYQLDFANKALEVLEVYGRTMGRYFCKKIKEKILTSHVLVRWCPYHSRDFVDLFEPFFQRMVLAVPQYDKVSVIADALVSTRDIFFRCGWKKKVESGNQQNELIDIIRKRDEAFFQIYDQCSDRVFCVNRYGIGTKSNFIASNIIANL